MARTDTQKRILRAGLNILDKKSILLLSTADICDAAGVSSRTFYNYYLDKFDMAQHIVDMLEEDFWKTHEKNLVSFPEHFHYFYLFVNSHQRFFLNNFCYSGPNCLYDYMIEKAYEDDLELILRSYPDESLTPEVKLALRFYLYGSFRLMIDFINGRITDDIYPYGPDYVDLYTPEILKPFFSTK